MKTSTSRSSDNNLLFGDSLYYVGRKALFKKLRRGEESSEVRRMTGDAHSARITVC